MSIYNATSTIGTVLGRFTDWYGEWSFVDCFKQSRTFCSGILYGSWSDGRTLVTDEYGWPTELEEGQVANTMIFGTGATFYPAGKYHVFYDGTGTVSYSGGATKNVGESSAGHDVLDVLPENGGIVLKITATDPGETGDYIRNIKVIGPGSVNDENPLDWVIEEDVDGYTPLHECYASYTWHPVFLNIMKHYKCLRFMNWQMTNEADGRGITARAWGDRPLTTDAQYTTRGVPVELMCDLANTLEADAWFCMHHRADDTYVSGFAAIVETELDAGLLAYVEHSNETWNGQYAQAAYCRERGLALGLSTNNFQAQLYYHSMRSVEIFDLWHTAFGDGSDRVVRVLASQAANTWTATQVLSYLDAYLKTDAYAIAPYFGGYLDNETRQAELEGMTPAGLLAELEATGLPQALTWVTNNKAVCDTYSVDLIAYEGGQHLTWDAGHSTNEVINDLFDAACQAEGMGTLYTTYLTGYCTNGGVSPFCHFNNVSKWSDYGRWGALEYMTQTTTPRYSALVEFAGGEAPEEEEPEPEPVEETDWTGTGDEAESPSYDEFTLGWIRRRLVEETGWNHLVVDAENGDYSDNGCNQYIMDAQSWLDRRMNYPKGRRTFYVQLAAGQTLVTFLRPRYVQEVWIVDAEGCRAKLQRVKLEDIKLEYTYADPASETAGLPLYWSPTPIGLAPEQQHKGIFPVSAIVLSGTSPVSVTTSREHTFVTGDTVSFPATGETVELADNTYTITKVSDTVFTLDGTDSSDFTTYVSGATVSNITEGWTDTDMLYFGRHFPLQGLVVMPPTDVARTLMVIGEWYSYRMTLDDDRSVWTYQPDILIAATRAIIELRRHRVRDSAELYFGYADKELTNLNYDLIAEETDGPIEFDY